MKSATYYEEQLRRYQQMLPTAIRQALLDQGRAMTSCECQEHVLCWKCIAVIADAMNKREKRD